MKSHFLPMSRDDSPTKETNQMLTFLLKLEKLTKNTSKLIQRITLTLQTTATIENQWMVTRNTTNPTYRDEGQELRWQGTYRS